MEESQAQESYKENCKRRRESLGEANGREHQSKLREIHTTGKETL